MYYLGIDVGGSHITLDLVDTETFELRPQSTLRTALDTHLAPSAVLAVFEQAIRACAAQVAPGAVQGVGLAIPGPFDYAAGICRITPQQNKYEQCFGVNFRQALGHALGAPARPVVFNNDAACFALGEYFRGGAQGFRRPVVITLGTGFGASFLNEGRPQTCGDDVPRDGELWHVPYRDGIADDYFSTRWLTGEWQRLTGTPIAGGKELARLALDGDAMACRIYRSFGENLAEFVAPWLTRFRADAFVIGGNLARDWDLFVPALQAGLAAHLTEGIAIKPCELGEQAPIYGAALALTLVDPASVTPAPLPADFTGFDTQLVRVAAQRLVRLDGPADAPWRDVTDALDRALRADGSRTVWYDVGAARSADGLDPDALANIRPDAQADRCVVIGCGAAQVPWPDALTLMLGA
ncbi:MAG TPA: ROK family protein [Kiritimatiellia bacterium]|nr:ROK family protein [Kiritimatiellia bacterium]